MQNVLRFWYVQSPSWTYKHLVGTITTLDGQFSVRDTLKNLGKPIFQDYTRQGRIIGFFLRLARVGLALFAYAIVALLYALVYLLWLLFPILCLVWIIGSFIGAN